MRLAALMLVGAGEADRHLKHCLRSARTWADLVVVSGDGPDPATRSLIGSYAHVAEIHDQSVYEQSEHLARNRLLALADRVLDPGDIVAVLDADEEFAVRTAARFTLLRAGTDTTRDSWCVHLLHLWNPEGTLHRVDGAWQPSVGPRIYRHQPGYRVDPLPGAWVCQPLPPHLMQLGPPILDVLHWSYARAEHRAPKHKRYTRLAGHSNGHVDSILTEPTLEPVTP